MTNSNVILGEVLFDREAGRVSRSGASVVREIAELSFDIDALVSVKNSWGVAPRNGYVVGMNSVKGALRSAQASIKELQRLEARLEKLVKELNEDGETQP